MVLVVFSFYIIHDVTPMVSHLGAKFSASYINVSFKLRAITNVLVTKKRNGAAKEKFLL